MKRYQSNPASIGLASVVAGPIFGSSLLAAWWIIIPATRPEAITISDVLQFLAAILPACLITTPFGMIFSIVPNILGTLMMAWLGAHCAALRQPIAWAMVGALIAGLPIWICAPDPSGTPYVLAFALTGAACALVCRCGARWPTPIGES